MYKPNKPRLKKFKTPEEKKTKTGEALRRYCFWLLSRRDYGRDELLSRLNNYALNPEEAICLADEMVEKKYISDERMAGLVMRNEIAKGCGPRKIQIVLGKKKLNTDLIKEDLENVDWFTSAYDLKVKKFGSNIATDQKEKAKQIRFLQYRGFPLDVVFKVVGHVEESC